MKKKLAFILGIRPDIIRASLVLKRLFAQDRHEIVFIWSGQHYSDNLKDKKQEIDYDYIDKNKECFTACKKQKEYLDNETLSKEFTFVSRSCPCCVAAFNCIILSGVVEVVVIVGINFISLLEKLTREEL